MGIGSFPLTDKSSPSNFCKIDSVEAARKMTVEFHSAISSEENITKVLQEGGSTAASESTLIADEDESKSDQKLTNSILLNTSFQSNASNSPGRGIKITDSMMKEEIDSERKEAIEREQLQVLNEMEKNSTQKSRFERLQVLLDRSEVYAKYLLQRITERQEADKKKKEADDKKKEKKENALKQQKEETMGESLDNFAIEREQLQVLNEMEKNSTQKSRF